MSRKRRAASDDNDSLDLLLDTVSNVFGGVMFLTLLAALMILSRGASSVAPELPPSPVVIEEPPVDDRVVQMELEQLAASVQTQQSVLDNLPTNVDDLSKLETIRNLETAVAQAQVTARHLDKAMRESEEQASELEQKIAEMQVRQESIARELRDKRERLQKSESVGRRDIAFRPLSMTTTGETILVLRYGRVYLFQNSPVSQGYNEADFFNVGTKGGKRLITPKPHRGVAATPEAMRQMAVNLRRNYPPHAFHVTIAVWDDSFGQFNPLCDALQQNGYRYRTIPCDDEAELSFGNVFDAWVQ